LDPRGGGEIGKIIQVSKKLVLIWKSENGDDPLKEVMKRKFASTGLGVVKKPRGNRGTTRGTH